MGQGTAFTDERNHPHAESDCGEVAKSIILPFLRLKQGHAADYGSYYRWLYLLCASRWEPVAGEYLLLGTVSSVRSCGARCPVECRIRNRYCNESSER